MKEHQARFPVATMCRVPGLSRSGFYTWMERPPSAHAQRDAELTGKVRTSHVQSDGTYGAPRIRADLREAGEHVSQKRIARLMRSVDLVGVGRRRKTVRTTVRAAELARATPCDLVERDFTADGPNKLWVADIAYVPTWLGFLYLAAVALALNTRARKTLGWRTPAETLNELFQSDHTGTVATTS